MPTSVGPNTYGEENLVFGYDLGDVSNSYKGEPTTNIATLDLSNTSKWYSEGGTKVLQSETLDGYPVYQFRSSGSLIYVSPIASNQVAATTNDVTLSAYFKNTGASTQTVNVFLANDFGTDSNGDPNNRSIPADGKWYRQSWTRYAAANTYNQVEFRTFSDTLLISKPQVEYKKHVTPPVEGTRSVSGSLIDLTGNSTIDLTNVSFDSNAQMTFDGSSDYIDLGDNSLFDFDNGIMTIEAIITLPSSWTAGSQYPNIISKGASAGWDTDGWALFGFRDWPSAGQKSWGLGIRNGATNRIVYIADRATDVYLHVVAILDGNTMRLYENGVQVNTNTQTINPASNNTSVRIGRDPNSNYFPGEVPYVKIYNRALTASEVASNYKAIKSRFNI